MRLYFGLRMVEVVVEYSGGGGGWWWWWKVLGNKRLGDCVEFLLPSQWFLFASLAHLLPPPSFFQAR